MSDITINNKNFSRFTKRLQKALEKQFGVDVPLHLAGDLFSQALGVENVFSLQQKLSDPVAKISQDHSLLIHDFIEQYFIAHSQTKILNFSFCKFQQDLSFILSAKRADITHEQEHTFSFFLNQPNLVLGENLKHMILNHEDIEFLEKLFTFFPSDKLVENQYIGEKLAQKYQLTKQHYTYQYHSNNDFYEINNYGYCERYFVLVDDDFFERVGGTFVLDNDYYSFIDLSEEQARYFRNIETALKQLTEGKMVVEFFTPLHQFGHHVEMSKHMLQGIGTHYIVVNDGQQSIHSVNGDTCKTIQTLQDYYYFIGQNYFHHDMGGTDIEQLAINHPYLKDIQLGFNEAREIYMNWKSKKIIK